MKHIILETLDNTEDAKLRRIFYKLFLSLEEVHFNLIEDWQTLLTDLLADFHYRSNQGLEHLFFNLLTADLKQNELDFFIPLVIQYIDDFHPQVFLSLSELMKTHLSASSLMYFQVLLKEIDSEKSKLLLLYFWGIN